jgi:zinc/manganese transport system permease protein
MTEIAESSRALPDAILAVSKATGETEHLKDMLVGNILAVSRYEVIKTAILYGCVGLFHFIFRDSGSAQPA